MRVLIATAVIVFVDQVTKLLIKGFAIPSLNIYHTGLQLGESIPVLGDLFRITFVENPGMAFGIEAGSKLFLTLFTLAATVGITYYLYTIRTDPFLMRLSLAFILGGAIGNLIDRVFYGVIFGEGPLMYGKVVDFLDVDFIDISFAGMELTRWFVFNVADAAVSVGVVLMLLSQWLIGDPGAAGTESGEVSVAADEPPPGHSPS